MLVDYIDDHKQVFGVEPICRVLSEHDTQLVLNAIEHAIWTRAREGITDLTGLIDHHDRGAQYTSIAYTERLAEAGIDASIGTTGDSYDNALA